MIANILKIYTNGNIVSLQGKIQHLLKEQPLLLSVRIYKIKTFQKNGFLESNKCYRSFQY